MRTKWYRDRAPRHGPWFRRYFRLRQAGRFYAVFGGAVAIGLLLDLLGTNSIKMLFLSVLINGVVAPRILGLVMLAANNQRIMGEQNERSLAQRVGVGDSRPHGSCCRGIPGGHATGSTRRHERKPALEPARLPQGFSTTLVTAIVKPGLVFDCTAGPPVLTSTSPTASTSGSILKIVTTTRVHGLLS
jgi:hypothetical protein